MIKYAKLINEETGLCEVGIGTNDEFYKSIGMVNLDVEKSETDNNWYLKEKCPHYTKEEKEQKERERLDILSLTAADVERAIYKVKGMDFEDLIEMLKDNPPAGLDVKALKIELKANHFYRGNPYVNALGNVLGFTGEQLDRFFETGDTKYLIQNKGGV